jgi:hypothetical protein
MLPDLTNNNNNSLFKNLMYQLQERILYTAEIVLKYIFFSTIQKLQTRRKEIKLAPAFPYLVSSLENYILKMND